MRPLPTDLYTAEQTRELDRTAIEQYQMPGIQLMKRAGREVFNWLTVHFDGAALHVFCGSGNNAGDGYIIAALAKDAGWPVHVYWLSDPAKLVGDAQLAYQFALQSQVDITPFNDSITLEPGVVVDALLGTGLSGSVRESYRQAIQCINNSECPVVAVDIPSGLSADTGMPLGDAVRADCTVTFIGVKQGLLTGQAADYCGELVFSDLGIPQAVYGAVNGSVNEKVRRLDLDQFAEYLIPRARCAHKGSFGHVLIIGGGQGMGGAVIMAAEAALRSGAGLVSVATSPEHIAPLLSRVPEVMAHGISHSQQLEPLLVKADVLVVGPGLGQTGWSEQLLQRALQIQLPVVLDADALNLLVNNRYAEQQENQQRSHWVMTPHPGEAARLLGVDAAAVQSDRFLAVRHLQEKFRANILLKGAGSLICTSQAVVKVCPYGNPGMAVGGMGDVLSGIVGGLMAQGVEPGTALQLGVCLHGRAADIASSGGERGLLPTDLFMPLRQLVNGFEQ